MRLPAVLAAALCLSQPAWGEVLTWDCQFDTRVDSDGTAKEAMHLVFKFDSISRKAYIEGNAGIEEVRLHIGDDAFSFSEPVASGAVQTTTITRGGLAVHSRNTVILKEIVAAQHFGHCALH